MPSWKNSAFTKAFHREPTVVGEVDGQPIRPDVPYSNKEVEAARHASIDNESFSSDAQDGVKKIEAAATLWSTKALIALYIGIFFIFFVGSMQSQLGNNLVAYVYSAFSAHELVSVAGTVSTVVTGVVKLPLAKIMDVWGRPQAYAIMVLCMTLGIVMLAACNGVKTYAAAYVFYWVGYDGIMYVLDVFMADTSSLKNRALCFAFASSPYIATTWIGGPLATRFLEGPGWRWGYGTFAIIIPIVCLPPFIIFVYYQNKAKKVLAIAPKSGRNWAQSVWYYTVEFDLLGVVLLCTGFSLLLLPLELAGASANKWQNASMIAMIVVGAVVLVAFVLYERYLAPKQFLPFELLKDRTVLGACLLAGLLWLSFYCWDSYLYSYLQVVYFESYTHASYITNIYSIGSCFFGIIIGLLIRWVGSFKYIALFCLPIQLLGTGLMIYFRQPDQHIGYVIMCQILIAFSGGGLVICEQMAVMAATSHERVAAVLALEGLFTAIGGGLGLAVSGAIWTNTLPQKLAEYLPADTKDQASAIYTSYLVAQQYPKGSPTRDAVIAAYAYAQKRMCIAATCFLVPGLFCILVWKDIKVKDFRQSKGRIV